MKNLANLMTAFPTAVSEEGFSLSPPFAQLVVGKQTRFWFNIDQKAFPEIAAGELVEIPKASGIARATHPGDWATAQPPLQYQTKDLSRYADRQGVIVVADHVCEHEQAGVAPGRSSRTRSVCHAIRRSDHRPWILLE
jgi:hypothetical protein